MSRSKRFPLVSLPAAATTFASASGRRSPGAGTMLGTASIRTPGSGIRAR